MCACMYIYTLKSYANIWRTYQELVHKSVPVCQSMWHSLSCSVSESASQSASQSISQSVRQSVSQPASQSASQSINQSVSQTVSQSHKHLVFWGASGLVRSGCALECFASPRGGALRLRDIDAKSTYATILPQRFWLVCQVRAHGYVRTNFSRDKIRSTGAGSPERRQKLLMARIWKIKGV